VIAVVELERVARTLLAEAVAGEVVTRLAEADVPSLVLKGPGFAHWLYDDPARRISGDTDVLVSPAHRRAAERTLGRLGFRAVRPGMSYADTWKRARDGGVVDLHWTILGARASGAETWEAFADDARVLSVAGREVRVPGPGATALHAAVHAIQHDEHPGRPLQELGLALERFEEPVWRDAAALAARVEATDAFAAGLRLDPRGAALADRLGLPRGTLAEAELRAPDAPAQAFALEQILAAPGFGRKVRLLARHVVPSATYMRSTKPLAQRGPAGLTAAYVLRLARATRVAPPAARALRRARRSSSTEAGTPQP
jgi:Uncharacterised nucleotidyltransferase